MAGNTEEISAINSLKDTFKGLQSGLSKSLDAITAATHVNVSMIKAPVENLNSAIQGVLPPFVNQFSDKFAEKIDGFANKLMEFGKEEDHKDDVAEEKFRREQKEESKKQIGVFKKMHDELRGIHGRLTLMADVALGNAFVNTGDFMNDIRESLDKSVKEKVKTHFTNFAQISSDQQKDEGISPFIRAEEKSESDAKERRKGLKDRVKEGASKGVRGLGAALGKMARMGIFGLLGTMLALLLAYGLFFKLPEFLRTHADTLMGVADIAGDVADGVDKTATNLKKVGNDIKTIGETSRMESASEMSVIPNVIYNIADADKSVFDFVESVSGMKIPNRPDKAAGRDRQNDIIDENGKVHIFQDPSVIDRMDRQMEQYDRVEGERVKAEKSKADAEAAKAKAEAARSSREPENYVMQNNVTSNNQHVNFGRGYRDGDNSVRRNQDRQMIPMTR